MYQFILQILGIIVWVAIASFRNHTRANDREILANFGQMRYKVNGENIAVRAGKPAMGVPHNARKALS